MTTNEAGNIPTDSLPVAPSTPNRRARPGLTKVALALALAVPALGACSDSATEETWATDDCATINDLHENTGLHENDLDVLVMPDGTQLPSILAQEHANVGPTAVGNLNRWFERREPQAVQEFRNGDTNAELHTVSDFYGIRHLSPAEGVNAPTWTWAAGDVEYDGLSEGAPVTRYTYRLESGAYMADVSGQQFDLGPENPVPVSITIQVEELNFDCEIASITVAHAGATDASGRYVYEP